MRRALQITNKCLFNLLKVRVFVPTQCLVQRLEGLDCVADPDEECVELWHHLIDRLVPQFESLVQSHLPARRIDSVRSVQLRLPHGHDDGNDAYHHRQHAHYERSCRHPSASPASVWTRMPCDSTPVC